MSLLSPQPSFQLSSLDSVKALCRDSGRLPAPGPEWWCHSSLMSTDTVHGGGRAHRSCSDWLQRSIGHRCMLACSNATAGSVDVVCPFGLVLSSKLGWP